jgi:ribose transport system ATP-binding protein
MLTEATPRLEVSNVSKTFGANQVLDGFNMSIGPGEIHGLVGENGSGKSTFVKILTGYHPSDHGATISVDGRAVSVPVQWSEIHRAGVSVVHQDFGLIDHLSVAENIGVGGFRCSKFTRRISWRQQNEVAERALARINSPISPTSLVGTLPSSQRAAVAMARALRDTPEGSGLVVLDESTRSLNRDELIEFYEAIGREVASGTSVLLVTHSLLEIMMVTNRVTVLRDGVVVGKSLVTQDVSEPEIAQRMLGKSVGKFAKQTRTKVPEASVHVRGLSGESLASLDFCVGRGEIVGITGLSSSGFESIPYLLSGARPATSGSIEIDGVHVDLARASVHSCNKAGIALVPERRDRDGLALDVSVRDNIALPTVNRRGNRWFLRQSGLDKLSVDSATKLGIRPNDPSLIVRQLSGGNQQKVLIAKWLTVGPRLLVLHEPTQAVDVGAHEEILRQIQNVASGGVSVLLVSIDMMDLAAICDRILVYTVDGALVEVSSHEPDDVLEMVYGHRGV